MKWKCLLLIVAFLATYIGLRTTAMVWFRQRTLARTKRTFPEDRYERYGPFQQQWNDAFGARRLYLQFWRPCKSFVKDWGFLEVALINPDGERSTAAQLAGAFKATQPGWVTLIERLCETLMAMPGFDGRIRRLDLNYGVLTIGINPRSPEAVQGIVYAAMEESARTCDRCGARGWGINLRSGLATRCSEHQKEEQGVK